MIRKEINDSSENSETPKLSDLKYIFTFLCYQFGEPWILTFTRCSLSVLYLLEEAEKNPSKTRLRENLYSSYAA